MTQQEVLDIISSAPEGYIYVPNTQISPVNMFIVGNTLDIGKNWFAFFSNEEYREIFEKEFVEMLTSGEEVHT